MTSLQSFAHEHRLKIRLDECGDPIIPGKRGHLYFADSDGLCLMATDGRRAERSRWEALGGKLWLGDISDGVQDVKITNIPLKNAKLAIRMAKVHVRRKLSGEERERLLRMGESARFKSRRPGAGTTSQSAEG
jgi:hypothetical protein